jgi:3-deoxy-7-phosphoheptulonate synthase
MSDCVHQIREGNRSIIGLMLESNIEGGNQPIPADLSRLKYGCSITDPCMDWPSTEIAIRKAGERLKDVLPQRGK